MVQHEGRRQIDWRRTIHTRPGKDAHQRREERRLTPSIIGVGDTVVHAKFAEGQGGRLGRDVSERKSHRLFLR